MKKLTKPAGVPTDEWKMAAALAKLSEDHAEAAGRGLPLPDAPCYICEQAAYSDVTGETPPLEDFQP